MNFRLKAKAKKNHDACFGFFFLSKNGFRTYAFIDSMYKCYKCVHVRMYFRSVKVNGAMTDSQSTEFSLCGFIAVEQGHARGRVAAAAALPGRAARRRLDSAV